MEITPLPQDTVVGMNGADLVQVLLNLVINAFQSTANPHQVWVKAELKPDGTDRALLRDGPMDRVIVPDALSPQTPCVRVTVTDDGVGMDAATLTRIFEPYFTTKARTGTGLGLCIVQRLVANAGGILHVHSEPQRGTSFSIYIPLL